MWITGLTITESYFVVGFGFGILMTLIFIGLIFLVKSM